MADLYFLQNIIGLIFVGVIWGITNPYMEQGTKKKVSNEPFSLDLSWKSFIKTFTNLKFLIPFGLNQSGSLLYYFLLGRINLSIAPLIVNSVNCMFTYIMENRLKKQRITKEGIFGISLIFIGVFICLY